MARVDEQEYADKWAQRLTGSTAEIRSGVGKVDVAPGKKAADAVDRMLANLTEAITSGLWEKRVAGVSLDDWKKAIIDKGIGRIAAGVTAAKPAQVEMARKLLAAVDAAVTKVNATPRGDLETNINRAGTFMREMSKAKIR